MIYLAFWKCMQSENTSSIEFFFKYAGTDHHSCHCLPHTAPVTDQVSSTCSVCLPCWLPTPLRLGTGSRNCSRSPLGAYRKSFLSTRTSTKEFPSQSKHSAPVPCFPVTRYTPPFLVLVPVLTWCQTRAVLIYHRTTLDVDHRLISEKDKLTWKQVPVSTPLCNRSHAQPTQVGGAQPCAARELRVKFADLCPASQRPSTAMGKPPPSHKCSSPADRPLESSEVVFQSGQTANPHHAPHPPLLPPVSNPRCEPHAPGQRQRAGMTPQHGKAAGPLKSTFTSAGSGRSQRMKRSAARPPRPGASPATMPASWGSAARRQARTALAATALPRARLGLADALPAAAHRQEPARPGERAGPRARRGGNLREASGSHSRKRRRARQPRPVGQPQEEPLPGPTAPPRRGDPCPNPARRVCCCRRPGPGTSCAAAERCLRAGAGAGAKRGAPSGKAAGATPQLTAAGESCAVGEKRGDLYMHCEERGRCFFPNRENMVIWRSIFRCFVLLLWEQELLGLIFPYLVRIAFSACQFGGVKIDVHGNCEIWQYIHF